MSELLELSVAAAAAKIAAGELSTDEYFEAWRAAAAGDELNAYLWQIEEGNGYEVQEGPLKGIPVAVKDIFCTEGSPTTAGSRILEGYRPPYTATAVRRLDAAGARVLGKTNMDEFAMGSSNENSAYGPVLNPWDRHARSRRLLRRLRRRGRRRPRPLRARHRHRRLDPPAGLALRHRRPEADLRRDLALRDDRLRLLARPVRAADPRRHRRRAAAGGAAGPRPLRLDLGRDRGRDRRAEPRGPAGAALRGAGRARPRRDRAGRARRSSRRRWRGSRASAASWPRSRCRAPSTASPPTT